MGELCPLAPPIAVMARRSTFSGVRSVSKTPIEPLAFMHLHPPASRKCSFSHVQDFFRTTGHYNRGRPHMALGPGVPQPSEQYPAKPLPHRHAIPAGARLISTPVLNGLHHEYRFEREAA